MDGKPLVSAFLEPPDNETIPSWDDVPGDDGRHPPGMWIDPIEAQEAVKQLVALGYIEKTPEEREKAVAQTVRELNYNLARSYMDAGRFLDAIGLLADLAAKWPDEYRFGIQLVQCYEAVGRLASAAVAGRAVRPQGEEHGGGQEKLRAFRERHAVSEGQSQQPADLSEEDQEELRDLLEESSTNPYTMEYLMGSLLLAEGDHEGALAHLERAEAADAQQPDLYLSIAAVYTRMKEWVDVERCCRKALGLDPDSAAAHLGLARSFSPGDISRTRPMRL